MLREADREAVVNSNRKTSILGLFAEQTVSEFIDYGLDCAEVTWPGDHKRGAVYQQLRYKASKSGKCKCIMRNGKLYLVRED